MSRWNGGVIGAANNPSAISAKGVWSLSEVNKAIRAGLWPIPTGGGDPYFQYNTLLLAGQGTNGAQNNTILDSSSNNFTITRNGNLTQGTFTPFSQLDGAWSVYFPATYGSIPYNSAICDFGTGSFTIEMWVNVPAAANNALLSTYNYTGNVEYGWYFGTNASGNLLFTAFAPGGNGGQTVTSSFVFPASKWVHVAIVRNGSDARLYVDGQLAGSNGSFTQNITYNNSFLFGTTLLNGGPQGTFTGYISNLRVVKGSAVYTAAFTPSTAPLTAITNTTLLTCQSNRFKDNGPSNFTLSMSSASIQPFGPFGAPSNAYSAATVGGSGYFDGGGDYCTIANNSAFLFGTGNFTVECWVYPLSYTPGSADCIASCYQNGTVGWTVAIGANGFYCATAGDQQVIWSYVSPAQQWNHLAMVRNGTTLAFYVNGVRTGTLTDSTNITSSMELSIGTNTGGGNLSLVGYMSGLRIVKGTAVYDTTQTTLTVPTAPPTAIANTTVLLNYTNAGIIDNTQKNDLETIGNAQLSTTQFKWGASSMYFDGTADYMVGPPNPALAFGTGDFTIECWVYLSSNKNQGIFDTRNAAMSTTGIALALNSSGNPYVFVNNVNLFVSSAVVPLTTWTHLACVKTAGVISVYMNGNKVGSAASSTNLTDRTPTIAGVIDYRDTSSTYKFDGYIADLRVTSGYCRYPYNFTAPTASLPLFYQAAAIPTADPYFDYTTLLLPGNGTNGAQNNTFLDSSTNAFSITRNGNTTQGTFSPFSQTGWSNYFDGVGDHLSIANTAALNLSGVDFTVEAWVYRTGDSGTYGEWIIGKRSQSGGNGYAVSWNFIVGANNKFVFHNSNVAYDVISKTTAELNTWYHVAVVRTGTTASIYVNGVLENTVSGHTITEVDTPVTIGNYPVDNPTFTGYISNVRVVKGSAVYSGSSFAVPAAPLTAVANTSLLTCQSNRFVDRSTNNFAITSNGDVSVQAFSPFNPTAAYDPAVNGGSAFFDGGGDHLITPSNAALGLGTGDFTVECWYYHLSRGSTDGLFAPGTSNLNIYINTSGTLGYFNGTSGQNSSQTVPLNTWGHIALVRVSGIIKMYYNGVEVLSQSNTTNFSTTNWYIGTNSAADSDPAHGYMADARIVKGTAVYTSAFTPPTAPLTAISGTSLLLNYTNSGILDATGKNVLETVGGASISTTQSKFGGSSMYFDGSGDVLIVPNTTTSNLSSGDWTIEGWLNVSSFAGTGHLFTWNGATTSYAGIRIYIDPTQKLGLLMSQNGSAWAINTGLIGGTLSANTWYHVAVTRYGNSVKVFVNGVEITTQTVSGSLYAGTLNYVGATHYNGIYESLNGYINDFRVTKGIARYTSNFTPPAQALLKL